MTPRRQQQFEVGDLVQETDTGRRGVIVVTYNGPELGDLIGVRFEDTPITLAATVSALRKTGAPS
jgi:hypothetical protein